MNNSLKFLKTPVLITAISTVSFATIPETLKGIEENNRQKPNIIFIMADDLGYGDLSCYGQKKFQTPYIDSIAKDGIKFTQFYSGSTVCAPSRCSLMTGLHTGHTQIRGNKPVAPEGQYPLKSGTITITNLLKNAGYVCGMFGKWGLGSPGSSGDPMEYFDEFFGYNCQRKAHNYFPEYLWHNRQKVKLDGKTYSHDLIMQKALDFIKANKNKNFFCYIPLTIPHGAMQVPKNIKEKYEELYPQYNTQIVHYGKKSIRNPIAAFRGMMEKLDNSVGDIIKLLQVLDLKDNTLVIFTSDNGAHHEGGHKPAFWKSTGHLRGLKRDLYEGGIRVPFIAEWPGKIKQGTVSNQPFAFWDILPTFCELAGISSPNNIDGISFLPSLLGEKQKAHKYLYWDFPAAGGKQAIRMGKYKLIELNTRNPKRKRFELYNIEKDPSEQKNILKQNPEIVRQMKTLMEKARTPSKLFPLFPKNKH